MNFFEKIGLVESVPTQPEEEPNLNFSFDVAPSAEPATVSPDAAANDIIPQIYAANDMTDASTSVYKVNELLATIPPKPRKRLPRPSSSICWALLASLFRVSRMILTAVKLCFLIRSTPPCRITRISAPLCWRKSKITKPRSRPIKKPSSSSCRTAICSPPRFRMKSPKSIPPLHLSVPRR